MMLTFVEKPLSVVIPVYNEAETTERVITTRCWVRL